jgi:copper chaperone CopZ
MTTSVRFAVEGMHCTSCTALVEESLGERAGVLAVSVDLEAGEALVTFDPAEVGVTELSSVIAEAGYPAVPVS